MTAVTHARMTLIMLILQRSFSTVLTVLTLVMLTDLMLTAVVMMMVVH